MIFLSLKKWIYGKKIFHKPKGITSLALLMLLSSYSLGANTAFSQDNLVSVNVKDGTVLDVINQIETTTDYKFLYKVEDIQTEKKMNLQVDQVPIESILQSVFQNMDTEYQVLDTQVILKKKTKLINKTRSNPKIDYQPKLVSGRITHEGTPLLGATIMIKDTQRGTTSDMDGYFELQAQDNDVLVVSYLGYKTKEIPIQGKTILHIELTA